MTTTTINFPSLNPSRRDYTPGDWAQKKYLSMSGAEKRIRYGSKRTGAVLSLQYQNITDANAALFLAHYNDRFGTFKDFTLPTAVLAGWSGTSYVPTTNAPKFRYSRPPQVSAVRPGISNVSVELVSVI